MYTRNALSEYKKNELTAIPLMSLAILQKNVMPTSVQLYY
jgi:hypothetical protein